MTLDVLRDDALRSTGDGVSLLLGLPWIRSLPLASLADLSVSFDGADAGGVSIWVAGREVGGTDLADVTAWWFIQDRIEVRSPAALPPGEHDVAVSFRLVIPYLPTGPDGPLALPFRVARSLRLDAPASPPAAVVTSV